MLPPLADFACLAYSVPALRPVLFRLFSQQHPGNIQNILYFLHPLW